MQKYTVWGEAILLSVHRNNGTQGCGTNPMAILGGDQGITQENYRQQQTIFIGNIFINLAYEFPPLVDQLVGWLYKYQQSSTAYLCRPRQDSFKIRSGLWA